MHVGEVAEQERQRHDIKLRVDRIDDASEADVDRAGAHTFRDRSFVTELTVGENPGSGTYPPVACFHFIGKALHCLVDQAGTTAGVGNPQRGPRLSHAAVNGSHANQANCQRPTLASATHVRSPLHRLQHGSAWR